MSGTYGGRVAAWLRVRAGGERAQLSTAYSGRPAGHLRTVVGSDPHPERTHPCSPSPTVPATTRSPRLLLAGTIAAPAVAAANGPQHGDRSSVPQLAWADCGDGLQCATASVPLDHDRPAGRHISLSVARLPATDQAHRIGTLFVNNGGPGNSVIDFMHGDVHDVVPAAVQARFDIVGFDPRGVGESTPVRCFADCRRPAGVLRRPAAVPDLSRPGRSGDHGGPGARSPLPGPQRRPARPRVDGRRGAGPRSAPAGGGRREADVRRLLVRRPDRDDLRPAVPEPRPRRTARRRPRSRRVDDRRRRRPARPVQRSPRQPRRGERRARVLPRQLPGRRTRAMRVRRRGHTLRNSTP